MELDVIELQTGRSRELDTTTERHIEATLNKR